MIVKQTYKQKNQWSVQPLFLSLEIYNLIPLKATSSKS